MPQPKYASTKLWCTVWEDIARHVTGADSSQTVRRQISDATDAVLRRMGYAVHTR